MARIWTLAGKLTPGEAKEQDNAAVGRVLDGGPVGEGQPDQTGRFGSLAGHVTVGGELLRISPRGEIDPGPAPVGHPASATADGADRL